MPAPYTFPWGLHPLDPTVTEEIDRRVKDYGMNPTDNPTNENPYSGPRTAWIRVFSNGVSAGEEGKVKGNGFVLGGTEGFDESYGFGSDSKITIGVDCFGNKHEIPAAPSNPKLGIGTDNPHRPPPSIVSLETEFSGGNNTGFNATCRKTKITWKCYSLTQLEYLAPYFLTPRITVLAEWGWNTFNKASLVDLSNKDHLYAIFKGEKDAIDKRIKDSHCNYDLALGFITDYGYSMNSFGGYDCFTTITNPNYLTEGKAYQNRKDSATDKADPSGSLKLKDFNEFVFDDMENLIIKNSNAKTEKVPMGNYQYGASGGYGVGNPQFAGARDTSNDFTLNTKGKIFKNEEDQWMRMDLVVEIINKFFSIGFLDPNNKDTGIQAGVLDIEKTPMCAHPALKSVNQNFIIPNQLAPRFISRDGENAGIQPTGRKKLSSVQTVGNLPPSSNRIPQGEYFTLFPNILKVITDNGFDDSYDNLLDALITTGAAPKHGSFPQFKDYTESPLGVNYPKAGYWGYLEDIFVSVKYFKTLVEKNETLLKLIEELLQNISDATCNVAQLQLKPDTNGGTKMFVVDSNFTPVGDEESAKKLTRFVLTANNYAFMRNASFEVKISSEMVNQIVMQSASGKPLPQGFGSSTYDPKEMKYSIFSRGDRMFDRGVYVPTQVTSSNNSNENPKGKYSRMFTEENKDFYIYKYNSPTKKRVPNPKYVVIPKNVPTYGAPGGMLGGGMYSEPEYIEISEPVQIFILTETGPAFMKSILMDIKSTEKAVYAKNGLMPGTQFRMDFLGISGITFLSQFTLEQVPNLYDASNAVWQISDVKHKVENKIWTTNVSAQARPLITLKK